MVDDERPVRTDSASTAGVVAIVLIAVVLVLAFLFFILGVFPFERQQQQPNVDINLPDTLTPDGGGNLQNYLVPAPFPPQRSLAA
jgi:hypothetical protein